MVRGRSKLEMLCERDDFTHLQQRLGQFVDGVWRVCPHLQCDEDGKLHSDFVSSICCIPILNSS